MYSLNSAALLSHFWSWNFFRYSQNSALNQLMSCTKENENVCPSPYKPHHNTSLSYICRYTVTRSSDYTIHTSQLRPVLAFQICKRTNLQSQPECTHSQMSYLSKSYLIQQMAPNSYQDMPLLCSPQSSRSIKHSSLCSVSMMLKPF